MSEQTVLIVDDEEELRSTLAEIIESMGFRAVCAADGQEAIEKLSDKSIVVSICDIAMPRKNGFDFLSTLKKMGLDLPVILLTAYGDKQRVLEALRGGATDLLEKPFDLKQLRRAVMSAIEDGIRRKGSHSQASRYW